ncbi:MAG: prolyl oligopeptidase family serine peptidase [Candidatus Omnitrophota bacterium]
MAEKRISFRSGYQHMVLDYYVRRVRVLHQERTARLKSIRNRRQAEKYQEEIRTVINRAFQPVPEKTPLKPQVTGVLNRNGYRIEKVIFESRPNCLVTANLYLPQEITRKLPGVIFPCGHSQNGKAYSFYQEACQRLVHAGFVVLSYDPFSQGERDQYFHQPPGDALRTNCCYAHNMAGKQMELAGEFFGMWRAWDGIRALDYLLTRPEVDKADIGLTGSSGGGTMTSWLWAIEDRFTMAAPSCFVTTFLANLENELPADCEQYPPGVLGSGLEIADFIISRAPKPLILLGEKYDFFDLRGLKEAYAEIRRFYSLFGAEKKSGIFVGDNVHGYSSEAQKVMVTFFCHQAGLKVPLSEPSLKVEKDKTLFATPRGEVIPAGSRPIYNMLAEKSQKMVLVRKEPSLSSLPKKIRNLLSLSPRLDIPHYRVLRSFSTTSRPDFGKVLAANCPALKGDIVFARFAVETEGEVRAFLTKRVKGCDADIFVADKVAKVFLPHLCSEEDILKDKLAHSLMVEGPVYFLDVRGLGQSIPDETGCFFQPYGMDYLFHGYGIMLGESYLGRRVHDLLSVCDLLAAEGNEEIHLFGRGQGAIIALLGAVLHPGVKKVILKNSPVSCYEWTQEAFVAWPSANFIRGMLPEFDLPDCIRALAGKVTLIEPWNAEMKPYSKKDLPQVLAEAKLTRSVIF